MTGEFLGRTKQGTEMYVQGQTAYMVAVLFLGIAIFPAALVVAPLRQEKAILTLSRGIVVAVAMYGFF